MPLFISYRKTVEKRAGRKLCSQRQFVSDSVVKESSQITALQIGWGLLLD